LLEIITINVVEGWMSREYECTQGDVLEDCNSWKW
jgi:hypothetical protein